MDLINQKLFLKIPCNSPYKRCLFYFFFKKIEIFINFGPYGTEISKRYPYYSWASFTAKLFLNVPITILMKVNYFVF